ncbi:hypothetical protein AVEN_150327-1, partial [Araneus ventricosus]
MKCRTSKVSESTDETSVRNVVDCVRVVESVRLVGFRTATNPQVRPRATKPLNRGNKAPHRCPGVRGEAEVLSGDSTVAERIPKSNP